MLHNIRHILKQLLPKAQVHQKLQQLTVYADDLFDSYAKCNAELLTFIDQCHQKLCLPLDRVYTAKAFYHLYQAVKQQIKGKILFIHMGGLQGNTNFYQ